MAYPNIVTIGLYGRDEQNFFDTLVSAHVDLFCDIRQRRGVRGSQYAFANSIRLQSRLEELGIVYLHAKELAPPPDVRLVQQAADKSTQTAKRTRGTLSPEFTIAYTQSCLADFSAKIFIDNLPGSPKTIAFFCVESASHACHRSLVADAIVRQVGVNVIHL